MKPWVRAGSLFAPPGASIASIVARVGDDVDQVAPLVGSGPLKGYRALPREIVARPSASDRTVYPAAPALRLRIAARDYQSKAFKAWKAAPQGVVVAPCGAGKTFMGCMAIGDSPTPALVIVHRHDLATQWVERVKAALQHDAVLVTDPATKARVAIVMVQALQTWTPAARAAFGARYGLVVIDEAHHVPARTWAEVLRDLPGRRRLALTATPEREDGRTPLLLAHCGPQRAIVPIAELQAKGQTLAPLVRVVETRWSPKPGDDSGAAVTTARGRNKRIVDLVVGLTGEGRRVLVLVDRVAHAERLALQLARAGVRASHVTGDPMPRIDRAMRLDSLRAGILSALVATSVADEGLDMPELDTVVLGTPGAALGRVQQRIGRALRPLKDKLLPLVLDLVDRGASASAAWEKRKGLYDTLGWQIEAATAPAPTPAPRARAKKGL